MALPIWAIYMKKIYDDPSLDISKDDFEKPAKPISIELDCEKYESREKDKDDFNGIF